MSLRGTTIMNTFNMCSQLEVIIIMLPHSRLMQAGGWTVLNLWLAEAKKGHNVPLLVELLQVHILCF